MHTNSQNMFSAPSTPSFLALRRNSVYYLKRIEKSLSTDMNKPVNKQAGSIAQQTNGTKFQNKTE